MYICSGNDYFNPKTTIIMKKMFICMALLVAMMLPTSVYAQKKKDPEKLVEKAHKKSKAEKIIPYLEEAAELGHVGAMAELANIYYDGKDFASYIYDSEEYRNPDKCFYWANKAADAGHPYGKYYLYLCHLNNYGVTSDSTQTGIAMTNSIMALDPAIAKDREYLSTYMKYLYDFVGSSIGLWYRRVKRGIFKNKDWLLAADWLSYKINPKCPGAPGNFEMRDADIWSDGMTFFERSFRWGHPKGEELFKERAKNGDLRAQAVIKEEQEIKVRIKELTAEMNRVVHQDKFETIPEGGYKYLCHAIDSFRRDDIRFPILDIISFYGVNDVVTMDLSKKNYAGGLLASDFSDIDFKLAENAMKTCLKEERPDFKAYYANCIEGIEQKVVEIGIKEKRQNQQLLRGLAMAVEELKPMLVSSSRPSSSSDDVDEIEEAEGNTIEVPEVEIVKGAGSHGRKNDTDENHTDYEYYKIKDSFEGTLIKVYHAYYQENLFHGKLDYYYPKYNKKVINYKTPEDAARAGWTWKKEQKFRTIGKIEEKEEEKEE